MCLFRGIQSIMQIPTPIFLGRPDFYYPIFNRELPYVKTTTTTKKTPTTTKLELKPWDYCASVYISSQMAGRKFTLQVDASWRLINTYSFRKAIISTDLFKAAIYAEIFISFLEMADLEHLV